jgi:hypothetical protein
VGELAEKVEGICLRGKETVWRSCFGGVGLGRGHAAKSRRDTNQAEFREEVSKYLPGT